MKKIRVKRLKEICDSCGVSEDLIFHYIELEWIRPLDPKHQVFDDEDVARVLLIRDLKDELGVNEEAIPIILSLVDQINLLHIRFKSL